jgi:hypothetical protein
MKPRYTFNDDGNRKIEIDIQCPDKMSEILTLAIDDLELCEKDPNMEVNMGEWVTVANFYSSNTNPKCYACLAGGVMVKTLHIDTGFLQENNQSMTSPGMLLDRKWEIALAGLNQIRMNRLYYKLASIYGNPDNPFIVAHPKMRMEIGGYNIAKWDIAVPPYCLDHEGFKIAMRQIIAWYKEWEDSQATEITA